MAALIRKTSPQTFSTACCSQDTQEPAAPQDQLAENGLLSSLPVKVHMARSHRAGIHFHA